ncbi:unnamed protein product [Lactuca virosa]|uniref:RING-type E3 ubiquitin transferase n=1 Tax=Lactuca virosa TaxID=75947 RepID=A0AAU9LKC7_9ASTR|nr:unnamed protein product [Lactuca virosa]
MEKNIFMKISKIIPVDSVSPLRRFSEKHCLRIARDCCKAAALDWRHDPQVQASRLHNQALKINNQSIELLEPGSVIFEMNSICCCQCGDDLEEFPTNAIYRHCLCLRFFFHQLFSGYGALFQRIEGLPVSSPIQGTASSSVGFTLPTSLNDEIHSSTRPLPYESDHRFSRLQRGLVSRREKSMTHFQEDSQALRRSMSSSESLEKVKVPEGVPYEQSSDNEDVCPTCLEEYTLENPKIVTQCTHHFHLGCIYEWMERSDTCPMCGKVMEFCESP